MHADTLWRALYRDLAEPARAADLPGLPSGLRQAWSGAAGGSPVVAVEREVVSTDGLTRKWSLRLGDGAVIETVVMGYPGRRTACVSTQAGCAMGCVFCATGQAGFRRHLEVPEIVAQIIHVQRALRTSGAPGLRNVVLMGMGEPLHNYDAVMAALDIVTDSRGLNLGPSRITLSTVGHIPGILRMAEERRPYHLAISLHAATQAGRVELVSVAARWPLDELMAACREYCASTGRAIFFEWTLIAGKNDRETDARAVVELLAGLPAHVNLIPLNPTAAYAGGPAARAAAVAFQRVLRDRGIPSTVRQRRGIDVAAGCGQLAGAGVV